MYVIQLALAYTLKIEGWTTASNNKKLNRLKFEHQQTTPKRNIPLGKVLLGKINSNSKLPHRKSPKIH